MDTGTPKMIARKENGIGWMVFNEPLGPQKIAAIALICGGVVMLAASA